MRSWIRKYQLLTYFVLAYAIGFGAAFGFIYLNPGQRWENWSLPWFLFAFSPTISAVLVAWAVDGITGVKQLIAGFARWKVGVFWYLAAAYLFLGPLVIALIYGALGNPVAGLQPEVTIPILLGQIFFQLFSGPVSEEAGWRGITLPRLEARYNALLSSLILGVIWTCWHIPLFFLTGATQMSIPFPFYLALVLTITVYLTWLYNNTGGSLIITTLGHFAFNLTGTLITGPLSLMPTSVFYMIGSSLLLLTVIAVVVYFGPRYLSKKSRSELPFSHRVQPVSMKSATGSAND